MKNNILGISLMGMALAMPVATASAQGTVEDYNRAYDVRRQFVADSVFHWVRSSAWCDSSHVLHYQISTPQGKKFVSYDAGVTLRTCCIIRFLLLKARSLFRMMPTRMN